MLDLGDFSGYVALSLPTAVAELGLYLFDEHLDGQLGITWQPDLNAVVLVEILDTLRIVNDDLPGGDGLTIAGPREA